MPQNNEINIVLRISKTLVESDLQANRYKVAKV